MKTLHLSTTIFFYRACNFTRVVMVYQFSLFTSIIFTSCFFLLPVYRVRWDAIEGTLLIGIGPWVANWCSVSFFDNSNEHLKTLAQQFHANFKIGLYS